MLRFKNLGSGSAGNATLIEATCGLQVSRLLVDCGLSVRELSRRLLV
ncbi:MAG: MBL fold metallo-hydrolase, partial [Burkholderiales bacterium]